MLKFTEVVKHLLIINVLLFIADQTIGFDILALHSPWSNEFQPFQIVTHFFMHGGMMHILFNMFALVMFGSSLEQVWGPKKFLLFYFTAGLGAAFFSLGIDYYQYTQLVASISELNLPSSTLKQIMSADIVGGGMYRSELLIKELNNVLSEGQVAALTNDNVRGLFDLNIFARKSMLGASGAIMGLLVAFGMTFPNAELMLIFFPVPVKAKYFIPVIVGMDIFSGITGVSIFSPSNTAYWAHVGGALTGLLLMLYWNKTQFDNNRWN